MTTYTAFITLPAYSLQQPLYDLEQMLLPLWLSNTAVTCYLQGWAYISRNTVTGTAMTGSQDQQVCKNGGYQNQSCCKHLFFTTQYYIQKYMKPQIQNLVCNTNLSFHWKSFISTIYSCFNILSNVISVIILSTAAPDSCFLSTHFTATTSLGPFC